MDKYPVGEKYIDTLIGRSLDKMVQEVVFDNVTSWWSIHPLPKEGVLEGRFGYDWRPALAHTEEVLLPNPDGDVPGLEYLTINKDGSITWQPVHHFSFSIMLAWTVVDEMIVRHKMWAQIRTPFSPNDGYWCGFTPQHTTGWNGVPDMYTQAHDVSHAICRAAVKAVLDAKGLLIAPRKGAGEGERKKRDGQHDQF